MRKLYLQERIDEVNLCCEKIKFLMEGFTFFKSNSLSENDLSDKISNITKNVKIIICILFFSFNIYIFY